MKKITVIISLIIFFLLLLILTFGKFYLKTKNLKNSKSCYVADNKINCEGKINFYGGKIIFTRLPKDKKVTFFKIRLESLLNSKKTKKIIKDCQIGGGGDLLLENKTYNIVCGRLEKGEYLIYFNLAYKASKLNQPEKGKDCFSKGETWYCKIDGYLKGRVK